MVGEDSVEGGKWGDVVVDVGPDGGQQGGNLVFAGTPRQLAAAPAKTGSYTARYLKEVIG